MSSPNGYCIWTLKGGYWTVESHCVPPHTCSAELKPGDDPKKVRLSDQDFRDKLNAARMAKSGSSVEVIPSNLTLRDGTTYQMDCV